MTRRHTLGRDGRRGGACGERHAVVGRVAVPAVGSMGARGREGRGARASRLRMVGVVWWRAYREIGDNMNEVMSKQFGGLLNSDNNVCCTHRLT
jgi:hypothetical protein